MTNSNNTSREAEIEARLAAATPWPWTLATKHRQKDHDHVMSGKEVIVTLNYGDLEAGEKPTPADAELIAAAPTALRHLLDALREAREYNGEVIGLSAQLAENNRALESQLRPAAFNPPTEEWALRAVARILRKLDGA